MSSILETNSKQEVNKARKVLKKAKEVQKKIEEKGGEWVRTFRGYKFVKA